ncbi:MAG TPA: type I pullulanase, partial [Bacilli bacterium]|nr:type I pullulanase [Bacilli bacterium]
GLFDDPLFVDEITYDGDDLGVTYTAQRSTFKAWAPTTSVLKLRLYDNGTPTLIDASKGSDTFSEHQFIKGSKGVWTVIVDGDLHGKYYTFVATNAAGTNEFVDPYARAAGVNGLRGMIVDFTKTNPEGWDDVDFSVKKPTEIMPYELHVADLTADETWNGQEVNRKRFLGLIEPGTTYTKDNVSVKTGFDHIKELGVNALQILPFYDQENSEVDVDFNWGYNPRNYNVLEGAYASDPYDGLVRINEFKQVVKAYAEEDIRIIMDVVYNHVANVSGHSFSKLVPGYYFRYTETGSPSNASGVGNDTASERIMMARYMTDSTYFLASEYKLGGFRFDLMGLHTTESMNMLSHKLREDYREDIIVFGEAWDMDTTAMSVRSPLANYKNIDGLYHVGAFNDQIRDGVKGSVFKANEPGFVQSGADKINVEMKNRIRFGLLGKIYNQGTSDPSKTVNYVSVHDNNTLFDKLMQAGGDFATDPARIKNQALQAQSFVLTAQGISFLHAGSEILRSKPLPEGGYDHNSYKSPYSVNSFKWNEKITNLDVFKTYQEMIKIKLENPAFQFATRAEVDANVTVEFGSDIGYSDALIRMKVIDGDNEYVVIFLGAAPRAKMDLSGMMVMVDTSGTLKKNQRLEGELSIQPNTTLILNGNPPAPKGLTTIAIVGIVAGGVALIGGLVPTIYFLVRRKKTQI